jgi:hypothetical protein
LTALVKRVNWLSIFSILFLSACGRAQASSTPTIAPAQTPLALETLEMKTLEAIPTFTSLPGPCATPLPDELNDFIKRSITVNDTGKTLVLHQTSRFWIYLDDSVYPLHELLKGVPEGLIGYISNGSLRGPQCYPIMFEAVKEGKGLLKVKDFELSIIVDNNAPESPLPVP